jgi:hypothetical protein
LVDVFYYYYILFFIIHYSLFIIHYKKNVPEMSVRRVRPSVSVNALRRRRRRRVVQFLRGCLCNA